MEDMAGSDPGSMEERILSSAERLFLEKGNLLTSTTEIAKDAGCNQALVHYYFRTKDRLFAAIFEKKATLFFRQFIEIDESNLPFMERLRHKISSHYDFLLENPKIPFLLINEFITNPARIQAVRERIGDTVEGFVARLEKDLEDEYAAGRIRKTSPVDLILTLVSLNVAPFIAASAMKTALSIGDGEMREMLVARKAENIEIILRSVRP
jgi:TetR/AcrR family transcriptional regulator